MNCRKAFSEGFELQIEESCWKESAVDLCKFNSKIKFYDFKNDQKSFHKNEIFVLEKVSLNFQIKARLCVGKRWNKNCSLLAGGRTFTSCKSKYVENEEAKLKRMKKKKCSNETSARLTNRMLNSNTGALTIMTSRRWNTLRAFLWLFRA